MNPIARPGSPSGRAGGRLIKVRTAVVFIALIALTTLIIAVKSSRPAAALMFKSTPPTLTLTAAPLSFHRGDPLPPLLFEVSGLIGSDTFYTATTGGRPTLSTTANANSPAGSYPIHITAAKTASTKYTIRVVEGTMTVLPPDGSGARGNDYSYPPDAMVSVKSFGAVGDGVSDDTAAINRALADGRSDCRADYFRHPKMLYLPPGRYRLSGQLKICGAEVSLRGAGPGRSVLYLAPRTPAFNQHDSLAVLLFPSAATAHGYGNISFRNFISALGIDIGEGNDNAVGLDVVMNNVGAIEDVVVTDEESAGPSGINLTHAWNGPMLVKNVAVYGFRNGFTLGQQQYSSTFSHITAEAQSSYGFADEAGQSAAIEQMYSCNRVPAATNAAAQVAILHSTFDCGAPNAAAYVGQPHSSQHLLQIRVRGYGKSLDDKAGPSPATLTGDIGEYFTGAPKSAFGSKTPASLLNLPIQETPVARDPKPSSWISLSTTDPSRWTAQLASCASSTGYLAGGQYTIPKQVFPVEIPSCIRHLQLFNAGFNPPGASVTLDVRGAAGDPPLIIENGGTNFSFLHSSSRTLVIRHSQGEYSSVRNSGTLFLEDFETGAVQFQSGQHIWARQYDNEFAEPPRGEHCKVAMISSSACLPPAGVKTACEGCTLWILGPKTEKGSTNFQLTASARMELFGGFFLPLQANQQSNSVAIESTDSSFKADFLQYLYASARVNTGTAHIVSDTQRGVTRYVDPADQNTSFRTSMVFSLGADHGRTP